MRPTAARLAPALAVLALTMAAPARAANRIVCWKVIASQPCVHAVVGDTEAGLPTVGVPEGFPAWAKDTDRLVCFNAASWQPCNDVTGGVSDGDKGDITVSASGATWLIDADSVALGTDTTNDYVSGVTANQGLLLTGTEGATLGFIDCAATQILKRNAGDTAWDCAADANSGGDPTLAGDVDGLGSANDLDELAVEAELEGVIDLSDLQGAVTDAQVPNAITVDLATSASGVSCTNCLGGSEVDESALGTVLNAAVADMATEANTAFTGDSATAFFSSGTIEAARLPAVTAMASACTDAQVLGGNAAGTGVECQADAGGGGNSFETINVPSGIDPVADSSTDTLNITCSGAFTCNGTLNDTIVFYAPGVVLDIGDDAGNDSAALVELSTLRDDYGALTEPSADEAQIDFAKIPPYQQYDPNRPPASCATCDEFTNGTTLSLGWQNQESSTATAEIDGLTLYHPVDTTGVAQYFFTGPDGSAADWVYHTALSVVATSASNYAGIGLLATGTQASPTLLYHLIIYSTSAAVRGVGFRSYTSYTSAQTVLGTDITIPPTGSGYLALGYVTATKVLTAYYSADGRLYYAFASTTLAAHPTTSFSMNISSISAATGAYGHFQFVRIRTDASRLRAGE